MRHIIKKNRRLISPSTLFIWRISDLTARIIFKSADSDGAAKLINIKQVIKPIAQFISLYQK